MITFFAMVECCNVNELLLRNILESPFITLSELYDEEEISNTGDPVPVISQHSSE